MRKTITLLLALLICAPVYSFNLVSSPPDGPAVSVARRKQKKKKIKRQRRQRLVTVTQTSSGGAAPRKATTAPKVYRIEVEPAEAPAESAAPPAIKPPMAQPGKTPRE